MGVSSLQEALDRKNSPCLVCGRLHSLQTQCSRELMAERIGKLMEANSTIPLLMKSNKELSDIANDLQKMFLKVDEAHTLLMQLLSTYGETGEEIKNKYLEALDSWVPKAKEPINHDTSDQQQSLFSLEHLTPNAKKINGSIVQANGKPFDQGLEK